jgi:ATP-binding cassette, subfamily B, bacterial
MFQAFPTYVQYDSKDCGPTCLRIISRYYGKHFTLQTLRERSRIGIEGVSLLGLSQAAESLGFRSIGARLDVDTLLNEAPFPCICHWDDNHFVVLYKVSKNTFYVSDPARGRMKYSREEFVSHWAASQSNPPQGIVLLLEPTPKFYSAEEEAAKKLDLKLITKYLFNYKGLLFQLLLGVICVSIAQLIFPFLTKSIVDNGIAQGNLSFIYLVLLAQLMLFFGRTSVDFIRSWILLHISTRINVSIISDFFIKLMRLPLSYFDSKMTGDILQRVNDHNRIEHFLTGSTLNFFFSFISLVVFSIVLLVYNIPIFTVFIIATVIYTAWVVAFLRKRRELDYKKFSIGSKNSDSIIMMITGMQEIKLNNSEQQKRWEWERIQAKLFRFNIKSLALGQYQQAGAFFINEGKNIFITFLAAKFVIEGQLTLGTMLAIQYIIGQLNAPVEQFIGFLQSYQDATISLERLNEVHQQDDEEPVDKPVLDFLPAERSLKLENVSFTYPGPAKPAVLNNINLEIPQGKITAIVGVSGSGKTTLLKLLLKFYKPQDGTIKVGNTHLGHISNRTWREKCGVVLQGGFIFPDTIANNIAVGEQKPDYNRLLYAAETANILEFINTLPLDFNTKIGSDGVGISEGQKQRILIARAVYKDPEFIFFDEATNSLDANNEKIIMRNLDQFFKGRTVVVVAHRLSTVKNADNIVVLDKGVIAEMGTHTELALMKNKYFELVRNQLELGK